MATAGPYLAQRALVRLGPVSHVPAATWPRQTRPNETEASTRHNETMGFRRSKDAAHRARDWREFTATHRNLFDAAGLPGVLADDHEAFIDFLMHGFLSMPGGLADGTRADTRDLNAQQWKALDGLVALYVERFGDPGVSLGPRLDE